MTAAPPMPAPLSSSLTVCLQTRSAAFLMHGRARGQPRPAVIGLSGFAQQMRRVLARARGDDPYADRQLLRVERALARLASDTAAWRAGLDEALSEGMPGTVAVASGAGQTFRLEVLHPYAFHAAGALVAYDETLRRAVTARQWGLDVPGAATAVQERFERRLRRLFSLASGYRDTGVTRAALATGRPLCAEIVARLAQMGRCPEAVLRGTERSQWAPRIVRASGPVDGSLFAPCGAAMGASDAH